jgi:hypothetical protein
VARCLKHRLGSPRRSDGGFRVSGPATRPAARRDGSSWTGLAVGSPKCRARPPCLTTCGRCMCQRSLGSPHRSTGHWDLARSGSSGRWRGATIGPSRPSAAAVPGRRSEGRARRVIEPGVRPPTTGRPPAAAIARNRPRRAGALVGARTLDPEASPGDRADRRFTCSRRTTSGPRVTGLGTGGDRLRRGRSRDHRGADGGGKGGPRRHRLAGRRRRGQRAGGEYCAGGHRPLGRCPPGC